MSNSIYVPGRGAVLVDTEATYGEGADPALGIDDVIYAEDVAVDLSTDMITRTGDSPERPGFRAVAGLNHVTLSMNTECRPKVQTGVTDADAPDIDHLLRASGWSRVDDAANTAQTYICGSHNAESAAVAVYQVNAEQNGGNASAQKYLINGYRSDWSFTWNAGERWLWTFTGAGLVNSTPYSTVTDTEEAWVATLPGLDYGSDEPLTAKGATGNGLVETESAPRVLYGGGSLGSPSNQVLVLSLSASGNMGLSEQSGLSASGGVGRVALAPSEPATLECVVEQTDLSGWNPFQYRDEATPIEINFKLTATGTGGSTVTAQIVAYGVITACTAGDDTGRRTWGLTFQLVYPEDAADASPAAGESPAQEFTDGADGAGIDYVPAGPPAGFGKLGIMAIQFVTT